MPNLAGMECMKCRKDFNPDPKRYVCDNCGADGILEVVYDYKSGAVSLDKLKNNPDRSIWRYRDFLPLNDSTPRSSLFVGWTPLYRLGRLEKEMGLSEIYIKDEGRNPTGSLKDRASAIGVSKALEARSSAIACASTGNAASSLAGFAASLSIPAYIFVPKRAPRAKIAQLLIYGAKTIIIDDTYDRAFELSVEASSCYGFYNRNCAYNPYLVEGKKTVAFEIWEQLNYSVPDRIYVSIGDGCITSGIFKGFLDLRSVGFIDRVPRIIAVQAANCNPVEIAMKTGEFRPQNGTTIADSIAVGIPRNRLKAIRAIKESKGECISVSEEAIKTAMLSLPRSSGVFGEPAGVTSYAGFLKQAREGSIGGKERIVILITGNGLKDIETALSLCSIPEPIPPDLHEIENAIRKNS